MLGFPAAFDPLVPPEALIFLGAGPWSALSALAIGAPIVVLAVFALFGSARGRLGAFTAWAVALLCLTASAASVSFPVATGGDALITPFPGPLVSGMVLALLAAALLGADELLVRRDASLPSGRPAPVVRVLLIAGSVVLAVGPLTSLGAWTVPQLVQAADAEAAALTLSDAPDALSTAPDGGPAASTDFGTTILVRPGAERTLPATAADRGTGPDRTRTLVLTISGKDGDGVTAALMRGGGTTHDSLSQLNSAAGLSGDGSSPQLRADDAATAALRRTAAILVGGTGADPRAELGRFGIGYVVLRQSDTAAELLAERLNAVPGLAAVGDTPSGWRVARGACGFAGRDGGRRRAERPGEDPRR